MAEPTYVIQFVFILISAQLGVSLVITEEDFLDLKMKMAKMESKIEALELKGIRQQNTILDLQYTVQRQSSIIAENENILKKNEDAMAELRQTVNRQNHRLKQHHTTITRMNKMFNSLIQNKLSNIGNKATKHQQQLPTTDVHMEEKTTEAVSNDNNDNEQDSKTSNTSIENQNTPAFKEQKRGGPSEGIAFMTRSSHIKTSLGPYQNIVFDKVILNTAGGYHNQHGVFVVPQSGYYFFSASLLSDSRHVQADIVKNGDTYGTVIAQGRDTLRDQGSSTVIMKANQSDEIWIRNIAAADEVSSYSTFCGYMMWPL